MNRLQDKAVGEIFETEGHYIMVVEIFPEDANELYDCRDCFYNWKTCCAFFNEKDRPCLSEYRTDGKNVIFKEIFEIEYLILKGKK